MYIDRKPEATQKNEKHMLLVSSLKIYSKDYL